MTRRHYPFFVEDARIRSGGVVRCLMDIVECRSDSEYAERPLALTWEGRRLEIAEVFASWRGPGEKGFRVKTADGLAFELAYHELPDEWQVLPL